MLRPDPLATGVGGARPSYLTPACELEKIDIPTFSPYITRMNSTLNADMWSTELLRQYRQAGMAVIHAELDPKDFWNGEDPGDYSEPVAWGKVMGLRVAKIQRPEGIAFLIFAPALPHRNVPLCSPRALLEQMKRYATDYLGPANDP